jgi:hypothetical protein
MEQSNGRSRRVGENGVHARRRGVRLARLGRIRLSGGDMQAGERPGGWLHLVRDQPGAVRVG